MYTKAAWNPNTGRGGWGAVLRYENNTRRISGGGNGTTNNRMEIMAAIQALEALPKPSQVKLQSDATYVIRGLSTNGTGNRVKDFRQPAFFAHMDSATDCDRRAAF